MDENVIGRFGEDRFPERPTNHPKSLRHYDSLTRKKGREV
jgi:hypothetical protein